MKVYPLLLLKKVSEASIPVHSNFEPVILGAYNELPPERKAILKAAMKRPCAWCEGDFKKELGGRNTGKSHGMCQRHLDAQYKIIGKTPPPPSGNASFDLSTLTSNERSLLGLLFTVVKNRQKEKGTF